MRRSPMLVLLVIVLSIYYWEVAQYVILGLALLYISKRLFRYLRLLYAAIRNYTFNDIDAMDGVEFERYVARQLSRLGYTNISLTEKYDYGVDIVASKDGIRWGIQVKRYSGLVKADAVRQVVTGLRFYDCERGMVITNSTYSRVAAQLAQANDCVLVDRNSLPRMGIGL